MKVRKLRKRIENSAVVSSNISSRYSERLGETLKILPCQHFQCPVACVKTLRTECRVGHVLRLETRVTQDTWSEEEVVRSSLDCEERHEEELCAPINCKHVNITHVCFDQVSVRIA